MSKKGLYYSYGSVLSDSQVLWKHVQGTQTNLTSDGIALVRKVLDSKFTGSCDKHEFSWQHLSAPGDLNTNPGFIKNKAHTQVSQIPFIVLAYLEKLD